DNNNDGFNDLTISIPLSSPDGIIDYYKADIMNARDYSPFGVMLYNRNFEKLTGAVLFHDFTTAPIPAWTTSGPSVSSVVAAGVLTVTKSGGSGSGPCI